MKPRAHFWGGLLALVAGAFLLAGCGQRHAATSPELRLQGAITQLQELPCPEGVEEGLWAELKEALEEALRETGGAGDSPANRQNHGRDARPTKSTSTPPTGETNRVNDLAIADNGDGTYTLTWHYRNLGDYDQNNTVALEDIIPLAEHFGETYDPVAEPNCLQAVIDGSSNGRIGIEDVTPIAVNFQRELHHYVIESAESADGPWSTVGEVAQDAGTGDGRLICTSVISSPAALWHRVIPYDAEGNPGEPSNAVLRPSNEPNIYSVSPTSGYQHEEYTFTAVVSGAEPLTYAWDFGGGATPNTSSEASPTVTLADSGEYTAILTVSNAYGEVSHPFTLTISERDMWAHTWSVEGRDAAKSLAVDEEGNIWVVGSRLLKFSPSGDLLLTRSLGGNDIAIAADGNVWVVGDSEDLGPGQRDVFLLKYDVDGNLLLGKTWGGGWIDTASALAVGENGDVYITGSRANEPFGDYDLILLKYSAEADLIYSTAVNGGADESGRDLTMTSMGGTLIAGVPLLLKFSNQGVLEWAQSSPEGSGLWISAFGRGSNGALYGVGAINSLGDTQRDLLLVRFSEEGSILSALTWGTQESVYASGVALDGRGGIYLVGIIGDGFRLTDSVALKCSHYGAPIEGFSWSSSENGFSVLNAIAVDAMDNLYGCGSAERIQGAWEVVSGTVTPIAPELLDCEAEVYEPLFVETQLEGFETQPIEGYMDAEFDVVWPFQVLVMKNAGT